MASAQGSLPPDNTVRGRGGSFTILTIGCLIVGCGRGLWAVWYQQPFPTLQLVIIASLASICALLANDQRRFRLRLTADQLEIWRGDRVQYLPLRDLGALSLRVSGGRYREYHLVYWYRNGSEGGRIPLVPFRRTALGNLVTKLHTANPSIQVDRELQRFLRLDQVLAS
jgi:hypothetical protein